MGIIRQICSRRILTKYRCNIVEAVRCEQGVPEDALDALQAQFLGQFIEAERLRYQNFQY